MQSTDTTDRGELAARLFCSGAGCAQAVFFAFEDLHGISPDVAARMLSSMCGGIGRLRETCGAFSGGAMVLGTLYGFGISPSVEEKRLHYARVQRLAALVREETGSVVCRDILAAAGVKVGQDPTPQARTERYYAERPCVRVCRIVADAVAHVISETETRGDKNVESEA